MRVIFQQQKTSGSFVYFFAPYFCPPNIQGRASGSAAQLVSSAFCRLPSASAAGSRAARPRRRRAPVVRPSRSSAGPRRARSGSAGPVPRERAPAAGTAGSPAARVPVAPLDQAARDQTARQPLDAWPSGGMSSDRRPVERRPPPPRSTPGAIMPLGSLRRSLRSSISSADAADWVRSCLIPAAEPGRPEGEETLSVALIYLHTDAPF